MTNTKFTNPRTSVLQPWVETTTFMMQCVLIASVRAPDGLRKDHPVKILLRWFRRCTLLSAFLHEDISADPYSSDGGSFMGPCRSEEVKDINHALELYLRHVDEIPHHFQLHLMHAAEILAYRHPDEWISDWWRKFYSAVVNDAHLLPESQSAMEERLGDNRIAWLAREETPAL